MGVLKNIYIYFFLVIFFLFLFRIVVLFNVLSIIQKRVAGPTQLQVESMHLIDTMRVQNLFLCVSLFLLNREVYTLLSLNCSFQACRTYIQVFLRKSHTPFYSAKTNRYKQKWTAIINFINTLDHLRVLKLANGYLYSDLLDNIKYSRGLQELDSVKIWLAHKTLIK